MRLACFLAALLLAAGPARAMLEHREIVDPRLEASLSSFYAGGYIPTVELPRDNAVTVCFGGGCSGQVRLVVDKEMEERLALVFLSQLTDDTPEAEQVAIGFVTDYFYDLVGSRLTPAEYDNWIRNALQRIRWECKTHAQNATVVLYQLQRLGLMRHNRLGPVRFRSGHYFATMIDASGAEWQVDSYFGDTRYSIGANCRRDTPICIRRLS